MEMSKEELDDFQRQWNESMQGTREFIDFLRLDPKFIAELLEVGVKPDFIVENKNEQD